MRCLRHERSGYMSVCVSIRMFIHTSRYNSTFDSSGNTPSGSSRQFSSEPRLFCFLACLSTTPCLCESCNFSSNVACVPPSIILPCSANRSLNVPRSTLRVRRTMSQKFNRAATRLVNQNSCQSVSQSLPSSHDAMPFTPNQDPH